MAIATQAGPANGYPTSALSSSYQLPMPASQGGKSIPNQNTPLAQGIDNALVYAQGHPGTNPFGALGVAAKPAPALPTPIGTSYADFMTPAMQQYVDQFKQSQSAQQQALNAGLVQAISGLGERRDAASKVAATLPGEYDKAYQQATVSATQAAHDAGFGHPTIGASADAPLIAAANAQEQAAGHANQPLLSAGITADYSHGRTALDNTHMQNQAEVAQAQQAFDMQMLQAQAQYQQQQANQQANFQHDREMAGLQSSLAIRQYEAEHQGSAAPETPEQALLNKTAIENGLPGGFAQQQQIEGSGDYARALNYLRGGTGWFVDNKTNFRPNNAGDKTKLLSYLGKQNPQLLTVLAANHYLSPADLQTALGTQKG